MLPVAPRRRDGGGVVCHWYDEQLEHDWEGRRQLERFEGEDSGEVAAAAGPGRGYCLIEPDVDKYTP